MPLVVLVSAVSAVVSRHYNRQTFMQTVVKFAVIVWLTHTLVGLKPASAELRSRTDPQLEDPIQVLEARPFLRMAETKTPTTQQGLFRIVHRPIKTIPAERLRLPTPDATWKLTGRVGRLADSTIVAGFGAYVYWSDDEGRSWTGRHVTNLPETKGVVNFRAFGVSDKAILAAHDRTALPRLKVPDRETYPLGISHSADLGKTWKTSRLKTPAPYTFLAGDGNHIVSMGDGRLIAALDAANHNVATFSEGWLAQVFFHSHDEGRTWAETSLLRNRAAEVGLLPLGGDELLAACRGMSNPDLGGKTVQLRRSHDGGRTWSGPQQLTWVFGQAHCDIARYSENAIVAVYENRYPVSDPSIRARISLDMGKTWQRELYILAHGVGYAGSVVLEDGTIITVTGDGEVKDGRPSGRGYTLQAIRWKPL
jgi:hypothetical protein